MLTLPDGRQMYREFTSDKKDAAWVVVGARGRNVDPAQRVPASAIGSDGVIRLEDGHQLYVNQSADRAATTEEKKHTNKDPRRRQWTVSTPEVRERSKAETVAREAAYYLGLIPLWLLVACLCKIRR